MGRGGVERRLARLESRVPPPRSSGRARAYMSGLLDRYAAARQQGFVPEELEAEARAVNEAIQRRLAETRGEGAS